MNEPQSTPHSAGSNDSSGQAADQLLATQQTKQSLQKTVLNVGGGAGEIEISSYFDTYRKLRLDINPKVSPDICMDARTLDKLSPNQVDAIYCSHNLEHYYAHEVPKVLKGFDHILRPEGFIELRVPDMEGLIKHLAKNDQCLEDTLYTTNKGLVITALDVFYGYGRDIERTGEDFMAHKTGFTKKTLKRHLNAAGFNIVVFRPGRIFEIFVHAFRAKPSDEFLKQLKISWPD